MLGRPAALALPAPVLPPEASVNKLGQCGRQGNPALRISACGEVSRSTPDPVRNGAARSHSRPGGWNLRCAIVFTGFACLAYPLPRALAEFRPLEPHAEAKVGPISAFIAADAFKLGSRIGGRTLSAVGLNFAEHFLSVVEKDVPATSLRVWTLRYTTGDKSLIKALRGEEHAAVPFLAYIHRVMEMGEGGAGHTDWRSNFAYVRSPVDQRLWAVHWSVNYANEWNIGAVYVPHPRLDWRSGSHFFSDRHLLGTSEGFATVPAEAK